jgi:hypothetical protein
MATYSQEWWAEVLEEFKDYLDDGYILESS